MTRHGVPSPHQDVTSPLQTKPGVLRDGGGGGGGRLVWCSLGCVTGCVSLGEEIQQCGPLTMWHSEPWHSDTHTSTLNTLNVSSLLSAMWHCEGFSVKTHDTRQLQSPGRWKQSTDHWLLNYIISLSLMPAMSINNSAGPHPSVSWADVQCVICRQCVICILTSDQPIKLVGYSLSELTMPVWLPGDEQLAGGREHNIIFSSHRSHILHPQHQHWASLRNSPEMLLLVQSVQAWMRSIC